VVFVSVGTATGSPRIALPLAGDDGQRRYRLGTVRVIGDYGIKVGQLEQRAGQHVLPLTWTTHNPLPDDAGPFCHFDRDGRIEFQGHPESDNSLSVLRKPGTVKLGCTFNVPDDAKDSDFTVYVGLWSPTRQGARNHEERLLPDTGEADRRVLVGRLQVNESGQPTLEVAQRKHTGRQSNAGPRCWPSWRAQLSSRQAGQRSRCGYAC